MQTDNYKTKVKFLIDRDGSNNVFAYFPEELYNSDFMTCYSHVGQHSACRPDYAKACIKATPDQYHDLKTELESIGYNLQIL